MPRSKGMTDSELATLCDGWIQDAQAFDQSDMATHRAKAIDFYEGRIDVQAEENRSSVVSPDLADVVEWIIPGLLRVFLASDRIAVYEPRKPEGEESAKQATDGINYEFMSECDGYNVLNGVFHDALLHGNGVVKHWFDSAPEYRTETLTGLTEDQYFALLGDDTVEEVLEKREYLVGPDGQELEAGERETGEDDGTPY